MSWCALPKRAAFAAVCAVLLLSIGSTALAVEALYDFEALTPNLPLGGQDGWETQTGSYVYVAGRDDNQFVTADRGASLYRENDESFTFPGVAATETAAVMEVDILFAGVDPSTEAAVSINLGPYLGIGSIGGSDALFYTRGAAGPEYGAEIGSAASPGDWIRMRLEMDLTQKVAGHEDLAPGVGTLSYKNLTLGETAFTTVMSDIPLNIPSVDTMGGIGGGVHMYHWGGSHPLGDTAIDNIRVETATEWQPPTPEPPNPPTAYSEAIMADSPAAYWRLSDPATSYRPYEEVSEEWLGDWGGGEAFEQPGALPGESSVTSIGYRSTGGTMTTPGNDLFAGQTQLTLEMWVKPVGGDSSGIHYLEWGLSDFSLEGAEPTPRWYVNNTFLGDVNLASEEWAHLALVFDGDAGTARIYKNGVEVSLTDSGVPAAIASSPAGGQSDFCLANRPGWTRYVDGDFQELAIYQAALTAEQILAHYEIATSGSLDGDLNGDGYVGSADLDIVRSHWGETVETGCLLCGDPSGDGFVGSSDLDIVRANWGASMPPATAVPEPSAVLLLFGAAATALFFGRRRNGKRAMKYLSTGMVMIVAVALVAGSAGTASAADVLYDFESLLGGTGVLGTPLGDQDNWEMLYGGFSYVTTLDGSQVVNADREARIFRDNDVNFRFPGLLNTETNAVMEVDVRFPGEDPVGGAVVFYNDGPWLGMAPIGDGATQFYMRGAGYGQEYGFDVAGEADPGEWVRMRLEMDLTTGSGVGQLSYKNLTRGATTYTSLMTDIPLEISVLGGIGGIPGNMNVGFYAANYPLLNVAVDNIHVSSANDWDGLPDPPNPPTAYSQNILDDSPAAYWRLADGDGAYRPFEEVTQNYLGDYGGGELFEQPGALASEPQITATGYRSEGNTMSIPVEDLMGGAEAFSMELWVRPDGDYASGVHYFEGGTNSDFSFEGYRLTPSWYVNNTKAGEVTLTDRTWQHLAFVYDGTLGESWLYLDGQEASHMTGLPSAINDISTFYLGSRGGTNRYVDADFQELVMFDRALTAAEVADHYGAASAPAAGVPEPGSAVLLLCGIGWLLAARRRNT